MSKIEKAPTVYNGTLGELYDNWAKHVLLKPSVVEEFHRQFCIYLESEDPLFLVRFVNKQVRGQTMRTDEGALCRPTDNAPAWWIHYQLFSGQFHQFASFAEFVESIPCHMFKVGLPDNVNKAGWHVAHIFDVKDRDVDFHRWGRDELVRRTARNVHPCNYFYIPKCEWARHGSDSTIIAFFYDRFREMYRPIWDEFMSLVGGSPLPVPVGAREYRYSFSAAQTVQSASWAQDNTIKELPHEIRGNRTIRSDEPFPPAHLGHLARRVQNSDLSVVRRDWTGNDETNRNHYGAVNLSESPLRIRLSWKKGPKDSVYFIGVYDLDLRQLLSAGYVRRLPKSQNEIRLRFYHDWDGVIYIQVKSTEPRLPIGRVP